MSRYQRTSGHIHVAAYEGGLRVFCPAPHGSETEMCRPLGEFHFTYSMAVRPNQTPPERRRNRNAVPPYTAHCTCKIYSMRNMGEKKVLFNPVYKCFTCRENKQDPEFGCAGRLAIYLKPGENQASCFPSVSIHSAKLTTSWSGRHHTSYLTLCKKKKQLFLSPTNMNDTFPASIHK